MDFDPSSHIPPSSPIPNTISTPCRRRLHQSTTSSAYRTPQGNRSHLASSDVTPTLSRHCRGGGIPYGRRVPARSTSTSDDIPMSSDGGDGYDMGGVGPTYVWGTNIIMEDVNDAMQRFLKRFRGKSTSRGILMVWIPKGAIYFWTTCIDKLE